MNAPKSRSGGKKAKTTMAGIAIAILLGGYSLLRPTINEATGLNLPALPAKQVADAPEGNAVNANVPDARTSDARTSDTRTSDTKTPDATTRQSAQTNTTTAADDDLKYGLLQEVGRERYMSPAGVLYTPGSAEGHRLEHLRRHTEDMPGRPGKHGVFDGGMEGALAVIDTAYEKAQANQRTTKEVDGKRTIFTVDMGKRVGYVGGRDGNRSRKPMARRVKLVLEGNRLITAFPL